MTPLAVSPIPYAELPIEARALLFIFAQSAAARFLAQPPTQSELAPLLESMWNRNRLCIHDISDPWRMTALIEKEFEIAALVASTSIIDKPTSKARTSSDERRLSAHLEAAHRWIREQILLVAEVEAILSHACELRYLYEGRITAKNLPEFLQDPYELMSLARPPKEKDDVTGMDQYAHWIARWLVVCLPGDAELQEALCRQILVHAQSRAQRFVY